ncbi:MAG: hypothetical protein ACLQVX_21170 [Limisphaerales bacterium]
MKEKQLVPAKTAAPTKARVLVLARDSSIERQMVAALPSERCEIISAANGRQALDIARTGRVDVLVLDFDSHSRHLSRLAATSGLAQRPCPTLVLADSLEELTLASETGADGVLIKPLDPEQGRTLIHNLLAEEGTPTLAD